MDENEFENIKAHYFIGKCLTAVKHGKTINEDSIEDMIEDAEKDAITSERENGKYVDKIEGV